MELVKMRGRRPEHITIQVCYQGQKNFLVRVKKTSRISVIGRYTKERFVVFINNGQILLPSMTFEQYDLQNDDLITIVKINQEDKHIDYTKNWLQNEARESINLNREFARIMDVQMIRSEFGRFRLIPHPPKIIRCSSIPDYCQEAPSTEALPVLWKE